MSLERDFDRYHEYNRAHRAQRVETLGAAVTAHVLERPLRRRPRNAEQRASHEAEAPEPHAVRRQLGHVAVEMASL
jgi:hypothetical protein